MGQPATVYWNPSPLGFLKVNWDASLNIDKGRMGVGIIVRDSLGRIVATSSFSVPVHVDMVVTEAMAALQAVEFCHGRSLLKIILKVDSLKVVSTIKNQKFIWATHGQIIVDILDVLCYFQVWEVCHIKRASNSVAHQLAKAGHQHDQDHVWLHCIPEFLKPFVLSEDFSLII